MTDTNKLINWNRSVFDYVLRNVGTYKDAVTTTFADTAKPSGCGNIDIKIQYGYPEDLSLINGPLIALDDPLMPDPPYAGLVEEFDVRIYTFYGICTGQEINYNRRLRDRLAEAMRKLFEKGAVIVIYDYEQSPKVQIDQVYSTYCDLKTLKSTSINEIDRFRFALTVNLRGFY